MVETQKELTTIQISKKIYIWLECKKIHPRQSFNEVLEGMQLDEKG